MTSSKPDSVAGVWTTADGFIRQELLPSGRYDEAWGRTRGVYRGRYEVSGARIQFLR